MPTAEACVRINYKIKRILKMAKNKDIVQIKNPKSGKYVKIDRSEGKIISHKKSDGPYKGVPVARKKKK